MSAESKASTNYVFAALAAGLGAWIFVYWEHFSVLASRWNNDDYSYCYLVPLVFLWLIYESRNDILSSAGGGNILGYLFIAGAALLYVAGRFSSIELLVYASMWASLAALALAFLGDRSAKELWFPFLILLFAIPAPPFITNTLSFKLKIISSELSAQLLRVLSVPVYQEGNIIDLGAIQLQVVDACSGLRYFMPTILISLLLGHFFLKKSWHKVLLVGISPFVAIASNVIRISVTGLLVRYVSPALGEGFFHDFSGWLVYMANVSFLAVVIVILRRFFPSSRNGGNEGGSSGKGLSVRKSNAVALGIVAVLLLGAWQMQKSFLTNQVVPEFRSFKDFPTEIGNWTGERGYLDQATLDSLWADDYFMGHFLNEKTGNMAQVLIPYYGHQTTQHAAHAPTSCLLGGGWTILSKKEMPPAPDAGRPFPVHRILLTKDGSTIVSYFWFSQRGRHVTSEWMNKFYLMWDAFTLRRTDGALIRIEMLLNQNQTLEEGQDVMDSFAGRINELLSGYLPQREVQQTGQALEDNPSGSPAGDAPASRS